MNNAVEIVSKGDVKAFGGMDLLGANDLRRWPLEMAQRLHVNTSRAQQVWHRWGDVRNPPLVLWHGGSGSWMHWIKNIQAHAHSHCVYALDLPGMGDSELPKGALDADDLTPSLIEGLTLLFGSEKTNLMGFSFGALCAGLVAVQAGERFERLILVGTPGLGLYREGMRLQGLTPGMSESDIAQVMKHNLMAMMLHREQSVDAFTLALQYKNVQRDRLRRRRLARSSVMLDLQKRWPCEVHAIWGAHDALYASKLEQAQSALSHCDLKSNTILPDAGHWVMYEENEAFDRHVQKLLA